MLPTGAKPGPVVVNKAISSNTAKLTLGSLPQQGKLPTTVHASGAFTTRTRGSTFPVMAATKNPSVNNFNGAMDKGAQITAKLGSNMSNGPIGSTKMVASSNLFAARTNFMANATSSSGSTAFGGMRPSLTKKP